MTRRIWEVTPITGAPAGYERLSVAGVALALTPPATADRALLKLVSGTGPINFKDDGNNPTASEGMMMEGGDSFLYDAEGGLSKIRFIAVSVTGDLRVLYYAES